MNNRIRELAEQAGFKLISENCYDIASTMSVQEFAELIVQDCISQIAMIGVSNCDDPDVVWTVDKAIQNIKQHLEIES